MGSTCGCAAACKAEGSRFKSGSTLHGSRACHCDYPFLIYDNNAWFACVIYESTDAVTAGTYVIDNMEGDGYKFYTSCIKAETIHPIDPKFLPGVCLPVVELETAAGNETALSDTDNAKLKKAADSGIPIICKFLAGEGVVTAVFANAANSYTAYFAGTNFYLTYTEEIGGYVWLMQ